MIQNDPKEDEEVSCASSEHNSGLNFEYRAQFWKPSPNSPSYRQTGLITFDEKKDSWASKETGNETGVIFVYQD